MNSLLWSRAVGIWSNSEHRTDAKAPGQAQGPPARASTGCVKVLDQQIAAIEKAIARLIESDDDWRAKRDANESTPGVRSATSSTPVAELPELGRLNRKEIASLVA